MKRGPTFEKIAGEFKVSFGYIRDDMRAICKGHEKINYTLILLVGCACEMLAAARGDRKHPERNLAEVLDPQWKPLANALFRGLRHGLAHGFDTKHLVVEGVSHQIYMGWSEAVPFRLQRTSAGAELVLDTRPLAELICKKIDELEDLLKRDSDARSLWYEKAHRHERDLPLNRPEVEAWKKIV
jgi:hypothetical protein